ncbi:MAG: lipid-A-disaccharide synthase, partial [Bacteroidetes bacterium RIFOXYA12_FULL_33_9]
KAEFRCWGGDLMQAQGGFLVKHYKELAFMGFAEVLMNLATILKNFKLCKSDLLENKPDVLILIDYPGFNLRMARFASENNIKVFYYISPQIWAWKQSRIKQIKKYVTRMFVILPFEQIFYKQLGFYVDFSGHPLHDAIHTYSETSPTKNEFIFQNQLSEKPIIAIIPGSRKQEIKKKLPIMLKIIEHYPEYQFVIAGAPSIENEYYERFIENESVKILFNKTYDILKFSTAALVTSGTATLETALFKVPQIVCYKSGLISYRIAKKLIKVKYISLVNLIMDKLIVKELIQHDFTIENLKNELNNILFNTEYRNNMIANYEELSLKTGKQGASKKTAQLMYEYLSEK